MYSINYDKLIKQADNRQTRGPPGRLYSYQSVKLQFTEGILTAVVW